jgi:4-hydroxy-tetrahydrodipicolinate reductase
VEQYENTGRRLERRERRQPFAEPGSAGRERKAARDVRVLLLGRNGKVGSVLGPALEAEGHELVEDLAHADTAVDFTRPDAVVDNVRRALEAGVPCVIGTTGFDQQQVEALAGERGLPVFFAPNFALGAVLMMRFAAQAGKLLPHAEIVELHHETKLDAPSGTAKATAALLAPDTPIHSVRLPGLVAHQEVIFGAAGQTLTIRHDTTSREAFVPGVLLALEKLRGLPPGLTVGLDALL